MSAFAFLILTAAYTHAMCPAPTGIIVYGEVFTDTDADGVADYDDNADADGDGQPDGQPVDNCIAAANGNCDADPLNCDINCDRQISDAEISAGEQADWNANGIGDACDDTDLDGMRDYEDNCRSIYNPDQNPLACVDSDKDRFEDPIDNCVNIYNPTQTDSDRDGFGDSCDVCRLIANPDQNSSACPDGPGQAPVENGIQGLPAIAPMPNYGHDYARGSGGCSLTDSPQSLAWGFLMFLAAAGLACFKKVR